MVTASAQKGADSAHELYGTAAGAAQHALGAGQEAAGAAAGAARAGTGAGGGARAQLLEVGWGQAAGAPATIFVLIKAALHTAPPGLSAPRLAAAAQQAPSRTVHPSCLACRSSPHLQSAWRVRPPTWPLLPSSRLRA